MLDFLLPYGYFWPVLLFFSVIVCVFLFCLNVLLSVGILCVYHIIPSDVIDSMLQSCLTIIRYKFSFYFEKIETNLRKTFQIHVSEKIPEKSILLWHPHDLMTITSAIHNGFQVTDPSYTPTKIVSLWFYNHIPIIKDFMRMGNCISSNYETIKETLHTESVSIMLGGIQELLDANENTIILTIKKRRGIFKIALETGSALVPIITYGESKLFPPLKHPIIDSANKMLHSFLKVALPVPTIESLNNWVKLFNEPLEAVHTYTGSVIKVAKIELPIEQDIDNLRDLYIKEVEKLFKTTNPGKYILKIT